MIQVVEGRIDVEPGLTLVAALLDELRAIYGDEDEDTPSPDDLAPPKGLFFVARDGEPLGCGGIKRFSDGIGEVKRMYVVPGARRSGVARAVLAEVEAEARRQGYRELRLETGLRQPEAIALYQSAGFELIPCWGIYAHAAAQSLLREEARVTSKTAPGELVSSNRPPLSGYSRENRWGGGVEVEAGRSPTRSRPRPSSF